MKQTLLHSFLLAAALLAGVTGAKAQEIESGEAFYIYRNDGDFNGFFFDEVLDMRYSKMDADSVVHSTFVMQEVVTADSVYRIPLAAIDSIGFVQPEMKLNPNIVRYDSPEYEKLYSYYEMGYSDGEEKGYDGQVWLSASALYYNNLWKSGHPAWPTKAFPEVGDIIYVPISYGSANSYDNGFTTKTYRQPLVAKVVGWNNNMNSPRVYVKYVDDFSDLFVNYIGVEKLYLTPDNQVRRKVAGYDKMRKVSGDKNVDLVSFNGTITKEFKPSDDITVALNADVEFKLNVKMEYNLTYRSAFVKSTIGCYAKTTPSISAQASKSFDQQIKLVWEPLETIVFPLNLPMFQTRPLPLLFVRGQGDITATFSLPPLEFGVSATTVIDTDADKMLNVYKEITWPKLDLNPQKFFENCEAGISVNGYVQAGVRSNLFIETNGWLDKLLFASIGVKVSVGPKISGSLKFSSDKLAEGAYSALSSGIHLSLVSINADAEANMKYLWKDPMKEPIFSIGTTFGDFDFNMLPALKDVSIDIQKSPRNVHWKAKADNIVLLPATFGLRVRRKISGMNEYYTHSTLNLAGEYNFKSSISPKPTILETDIPEMTWGDYTIIPTTTVLGTTFDMTPFVQSFRIDPILKMTPRELTVSSGTKAKPIEVELTHNGDCEKVYVEKSVSSKGASGVKNVENPYNKTVRFTLPVNSYLDDDTIMVVLYGYSDGSSFKSNNDTVYIHQKRVTNVPIFKARISGNIHTDPSHVVTLAPPSIPVTCSYIGENRMTITGSYNNESTKNISDGTETLSESASIDLLVDITDRRDYRVISGKQTYHGRRVVKDKDGLVIEEEGDQEIAIENMGCYSWDYHLRANGGEVTAFRPIEGTKITHYNSTGKTKQRFWNSEIGGYDYRESDKNITFSPEYNEDPWISIYTVEDWSEYVE